MNRWLRFTPVLACLFGTALSARAVHAQEQVRLVNVDSVGDQYKTDQTMHMELSIKATDENGKPVAFNFTMHERTRETNTVLGVDAKSHIDKLRRTYTLYRSEANGSEGPKKHTHSLEGQTVTLKRAGTKNVISSATGKLDAEDRKGLEEETTPPELLPAKPVAVGDTWDVDAATFPKEFGLDKGSGNMQGTLSEILPYHGHRCARLHYILDVAGQPAGQAFSIHLKLEGDAYYALDLKRMTALNLEGPLTAGGTVSGTEIKGDGQAKMTMAMDWLKVSGKSVAAQPSGAKPK